MKFYENQYYHIFNRTNNEEALFRNRDNYLFFLKKYRHYLDDHFDTIAYCLMPTHFHFLVRAKTYAEPSTKNKEEPSEGFKPSEGSGEGCREGCVAKDYSLHISRKIGVLLNSYAQAYNKMWGRHGNLFNQKTNAKLIKDEKYFIELAFYIHLNPVRCKLTNKPEEWEFSSYRDYIDLRNGSLPNKELIKSRFSIEDIKRTKNLPKV